jgi:hypothetical protein
VERVQRPGESGRDPVPGGLEAYFEDLAPILADHRPAAEYYQLAEHYGVTIQDDWIEELERTYGVKL